MIVAVVSLMRSQYNHHARMSPPSLQAGILKLAVVCGTQRGRVLTVGNVGLVLCLQHILFMRLRCCARV